MKITRRSDRGKGGHLLISVPAYRVAEVEAALQYLETQRHKRGSQVVIDLIVRAARRSGWADIPPESGSAPPSPGTGEP
jgi:transposase